MKRSIITILLLGVLSCISWNASAQNISVDICVKQKDPTTLQVAVTPDVNFGGLVSNIQYTLKWVGGTGAVLAFPSFVPPINSILYPFPAGSEASDGGFQYQKYAAFGVQPLAIPGQSPWIAGVEVIVSEINIVDGNGNPLTITTENFEIANDTYSNQVTFNGVYYMELNSNPSTGSVINCSPNSFPVEWLSFTGEKINEHDVQLDWMTARETNSDYFAIEKKKGNGVFEEIGRVKASGTITSPTAYAYLDQSGMANVNVYRLRQVDLDGSVDYSQHVEILFEFFENDKFVVFPSPTTNHAFLQATGKLKGDAKFFITDQTGRILFRGVLPEEAEENKVKIDLSGYAEGIYYVRSVAPNGKNYLNRIMKKAD